MIYRFVNDLGEPEQPRSNGRDGMEDEFDLVDDDVLHPDGASQGELVKNISRHKLFAP